METSKSVEWIQNNKKYWCAGCHVEINLESDEFHDKMREVYKAIAQLERALLDLEIGVKY